MRSRSAFDLINDVRSRSDQKTLNGQTAYITDAEILEWLNQAWAELYDLLTKTGEHYYLRQQNFQAVAGVTDYPLPDDHLKTEGVHVLIGGIWEMAHRSQFSRALDYQLVTGSWSWPVDVHYDLWGQNLHFMRPADQNYSIRHWYTPIPFRMTLSDGASPAGSASSIDGVSGWEQYAIDWAAQKCAERDENAELAAMLEKASDKKKAHIVTMSSTRVPGDAPMTRIVRGRNGPMPNGRWWRW